MKAPRKLTLLGGTLVAAVVVTLVMRYCSLPSNDFGYARDSFVRDAIVFGSCGVAALICVAIGILLFRAARTSRIHRVVAIVLFIPLSLGTALIPVPVIPFVGSFWSDHALFSGDNGFMILFASWIMLWFSAAAILVFLVVILCTARVSLPESDGR